MKNNLTIKSKIILSVILYIFSNIFAIVSLIIDNIDVSIIIGSMCFAPIAFIAFIMSTLIPKKLKILKYLIKAYGILTLSMCVITIFLAIVIGFKEIEPGSFVPNF